MDTCFKVREGCPYCNHVCGNTCDNVTAGERRIIAAAEAYMTTLCMKLCLALWAACVPQARMWIYVTYETKIADDATTISVCGQASQKGHLGFTSCNTVVSAKVSGMCRAVTRFSPCTGALYLPQYAAMLGGSLSALAPTPTNGLAQSAAASNNPQDDSMSGFNMDDEVSTCAHASAILDMLLLRLIC